MKPAELRRCIESMGWSANRLAAHLSLNERTIRRWLAGEYPIPPEVAAWLERRAAADEADPKPEGWG